MKKINLKRKIGLIALLLLVPSILAICKMDKVFASESVTAYAEQYTDISAYRGTTPTAPKPTKDEYKNWVFAGWYEDESLTTAMTADEADSATSGAWAKFVPAEVLSVKGQINGEADTAENVKMRLVTTIDSAKYSSVGFHISIPTLSYSQDYSTKYAYQKIVCTEDGVTWDYEPSVFHEMSKAFVTVTIKNISKANFDAGICVTPYWTTLDGTQVDGVGRYLRVNDALGKTVNIPIRLYSDALAEEGSLSVEYDEETFEYLGIDMGNVFTTVNVDTTTSGIVACKVTGENAATDGMFANIRFKLKSGVLLMDREVFDTFSIVADDSWNASYQVYTCIKTWPEVIPENLPGNGSYEVNQRIGLDGIGKETAANKKYWGDFDEDAGVYGGALSFASGVYTGASDATTALDPSTVTEGTLAGGETIVTPTNTMSLEGVTGVMWYVDFSELTKNSTNAADFCTAVRVKMTDGTTTKTVGSRGTSVAYYYQDGEWKLSAAVASNNDRISVPDNYKGWVYVPLSSYVDWNGSAHASVYSFYDTNLTGVTLSQVFLYSNGYEFDPDKNIVWDEILFVKGDTLSDITPDRLPYDEVYEVTQRVGLDGTGLETAANKKYWGNFDLNTGIYQGALSFASGAYAGASDATTALDPSTVTDGTLVGGETTVTPTNTVSLDGITGVMWYVDFSDLTKDTNNAANFCTTVRIKVTDGTTDKTLGSRGTSVAYYYEDGEWKLSKSLTTGNDRIIVPDNYKGWVYVPISSYVDVNNSHDSVFSFYGTDLSNVTVTSLFLYSNGYEFDTDKNIVWDEILFVKGTSISDVAPGTLPDGNAYEISQRIGLDGIGKETSANKKYWGDFAENAGVYGGALSFASGVYAGASDATTALDPSTVTDGTLAGGETTITPTNTVSLEGVTGVMWYVDFSDLTKNSTNAKNFCTTVRVKMTDGTTTKTVGSRGASVAYYYLDGEWVSSAAVSSTNDRISVPDNYKGWVYVPLSSYINANSPYDAWTNYYDENLTGVTLKEVFLYSNGYEFETDKNIVWDEILFVTMNLSEANITSKNLGITPSTSTVTDDTIVEAEIQADSSLTITPLQAGETTVVVKNTYGETVTINAVVTEDLEVQVSYEKFEAEGKTVVATDYGLSTTAEGADNATALQSAINAVSTAGGGTVYVPKGTYLIGFIQLKEGVTLKLEGVLDNYNQPYSKIKSRYDAGEFAVLRADNDTSCMFLNHASGGYGRTGADNFAITGGVIDMHGSAKAFIWCCADGVTLENVIMKDCPHNHAIQITGSKNVTIRNVMFAGFKYNSNSSLAYVEMIQIETTGPSSISSSEDSISKFADYEYISSENVVIENCYFGKSANYGAPLYAIGHHACPAKFAATGITIKNCTFDDPLVSAIHAYGWKDVEITGCIFQSETAYDINSDYHYMILLDHSEGSPVTRSSDSAYLATSYECGGIENMNIHDNQFVLGENSKMQGLLISLMSQTYDYDARAVNVTVADTYNGASYSYSGYKLVNNRISNVRFCDNTVTISNTVGTDYLKLTNVNGYEVSGNSTTASTTNITGCTTMANYKKKFVVSANSFANVKLTDGSTNVTVKYSSTDWYKLTIKCETGGTITRSVSSSGLLTIKVVADDGYEFAGFYDGSTELSGTQTYSAAKTITAKFTKK